MKQNRNRHITHYAPHSVKGFTLIEFLVASMLAMIVIVAASGTYMITRKLNTSAQERISVQQDIRNASVQMARDARMAGSFGCFNTGDNKVVGKTLGRIEAQNASVQPYVHLNPSEPDGFGVRIIKPDELKAAGLSGLNEAKSDALLFVYGQGATSVAVPDTDLIEQSAYNSGGVSTITALNRVFIGDESDSLKRTLDDKRGDVILSTCGAIARIDGVNTFSGTDVGIKPTGIKAHKKHMGEFSISKLHASLYVLGEINRPGKQWADEKALLRYDLGADGTWQNPQLLASGIQSMSFAFGYVDAATCKNDATSASNSETFSFLDGADIGDPTKNTKRIPPALVQIRLKYYTNKATGKADDANTRDYIINTTVRAGNTCANRLVTS